MKTNDIDFVITWVDDSDPVWRAKRDLYKGIRTAAGNEDARYRDWGTLRYWFRGVEKFAPWVRHIYFVTDNQKPDWLNIDHPKLKWVKHTDYIPEEYLPTFHSKVIEWNFHRIEGLSDCFVYFNDDVFLIDSVTKEHFFVDGKPCDYPGLDYICPTSVWTNTPFNNALLLNRNFNFRESFRKNWIRWVKHQTPKSLFKLLYLGRREYVPGFNSLHIHFNYCKKSFETLWEKEYNSIHETCTHKFRSKNDVSHWCVRNWQIMEGDFVPQKPFGKLFPTDSLSRSNAAVDYIRKQKGKVVCINDNENEVDFELHKQMIVDAFEELLPEKSSFELW